MMAGLPERTFIERWITPGVVWSVAMALMGQLMFTIWWARGESSRITAVEVMASNLRNDIFTLNTPLSSKVARLESGHIDLEQRYTNLGQQITSIDQNGSRSLGVISANQQRVMNQLDRLAERIIMIDKRVNDAEARMAQTATIAVERIATVDKRLENLEKRLSELIATVSHGGSFKLQSDESKPAK